MVSAGELCNLMHEVTNKDLNILVLYFSITQCGSSYLLSLPCINSAERIHASMYPVIISFRC